MTHSGTRSNAPVLRQILALWVLLAVTQPDVAAQVLNMSHDLVSLGIASENLLPNTPAQDARPLIQAALLYVQNHPVQVLTLDKGNYYLLTAQQPNATLIFPRLSNMTVDLAGSTIYFNGPILPNGINVFECSNLTLTNFQTDFLNPPYTHVQLTSVDTGQRLLKYQTLPGWPDPSSFNNLASPFGGPIEGLWAALFRNGAIIPGTTRTLLTGPITGNTLTLTQDGTPWTQSATLATLQPGDIVVVTARGGGPPVLVWESDSITLSNITIYGSPTWAVEVYATSNSTVDGVRVMPRPVTGLIGSNADGIHFASVRQNNHIRNSYVTRTLDDALIMDNLYTATVVGQTGPRQLSVARRGYYRFPNGTAVNFVDPATTMEISGATIVSQNPLDSDSPIDNGQVDLTFDSDLPPVAAGMFIVYAAPAMRGQGSTIEGNVAEDIYAGRGVWVSGVQGLTVQGNVLRRTSMAGIVVAQFTEIPSSDSMGPPAHDITISDNLLEGALGPAATGTGTQVALASIEVVSTNNQQYGFASGASNTNISITNNSIADSARSAIWVGELNGGTIANNLIGLYDQHPELPIWGIPPQFLTQVAQDFASPIVIRYSTGVTSQGNVISPTALNTTAAVEYYYPAWNFYFETGFPAEIAALDGGAFGGVWQRTGQAFYVWPQPNATSTPTCRFFGIAFAPKSSHFYTPFPTECEYVKTNPADVAAWQFENIAFHIQLADANGLCGAGTIPLYRVYNNGMGGAPNHRYTTSQTILNQMIAGGWSFEGNGNTMVFACVPQ